MSKQTALRILVTGGASGIGLEASLQLAMMGHHLIVVDRNADGGESAVRRIRHEGGSAEFRQLDLGDLSRIRSFAADAVDRDQFIDVLVNNAGLLPPMERRTTRDGFELGFGVACLGHYALTGLLLPALLRSAHPRVVSVSSNSHARARLDLDDLQLEHGYYSSRAYTNSKLACLMYAFELQRRATAVGSRLISVATHPGISSTPIAAGWESEDRRSLRDRFELIGYRAAIRFLGQTAAEGARSLVYAATRADVEPGGYYGPTGFLQAGGSPGRVQSSPRAREPGAATRLWQEAERLTDVGYDAVLSAKTAP